MDDVPIRAGHPDAVNALEALRSYQVGSAPLFVVGTLDTGITVLSQQVRALNLVWALVSSGRLVAAPATSQLPTRIAIVGAGFAGLTTAAALIKKGVATSITVFERRDTVLPLQQGSDSRWLHPHIYDWPILGSESPSAALPLLNWTASRASDVVVQVLRGWERLIRDRAALLGDDDIRIYCNTQHLQVGPLSDGSDSIRIEWVGEPRDPRSPANPLADDPNSSGLSAEFDLVIMAVGFGLEKNRQRSYWRNETFAQPELGQARATYIVSGAGDGAMIDLFRLRIAQFRQDRILAELFSRQTELLRRLREVDARARHSHLDLYEEFHSLWVASELADETSTVQARLASRLRHDTQVLLHVREARFSGLFAKGRVSFQNRLLAFLLFRAGGFQPSADSLEDLMAEFNVPEERVIRRHGTLKEQALLGVVDGTLKDLVKEALADGTTLRQSDVVQWGGGYFDYTGPIPPHADNAVRGNWRKEYLPSPTQSVAASFCAAVAGYLGRSNPPSSRLRVTFHRTLRIGPETVLQQCCEYVGRSSEPQGSVGAAGRTFPADHATIGAAYTKRKIFRTRQGVRPDDLQEDMETLQLNEASRDMSREVRSILAMPLVTAEGVTKSEAEGVVGVLYIDSMMPNVFSDADVIDTIIAMTSHFGSSLGEIERTAGGRVVNHPFWQGAHHAAEATLPISIDALEALEPVENAEIPIAPVSQLNFDFSDFERVEK